MKVEHINSCWNEDVTIYFNANSKGDVLDSYTSEDDAIEEAKESDMTYSCLGRANRLMALLSGEETDSYISTRSCPCKMKAKQIETDRMLDNFVGVRTVTRDGKPKNDFQKYAIDRHDNSHWFWGNAGSGKSWALRMLAQFKIDKAKNSSNNVILIKGKNIDSFFREKTDYGYSYNRWSLKDVHAVFIDDFDKSLPWPPELTKMVYDLIDEIYIQDVQCVITTQYNPHTVFSGIEEVQRDALLRRVYEHFTLHEAK